jgi:F-type H+-transporting ATPase subunit gamma
MATSKSIKAQLGFVKVMQRLIEALKEIDSAHFQSFFKKKEDKVKEFDNMVKEYTKLIFSFGDLLHIDHPLLKPKSGCTCIIVMSSDASFMGKLNTNICREAQNVLEDFKDAELVVLGKKGLVRLRYANARVTSFPGITEDKRFQQVMQIKNYIIQERVEGKIGDVYLVAARALSFAKQEVEVIRLLPAVDLFKEKLVLKLEKWQEVCIESNFTTIIEYLVEVWLMEKLMEYAYESKLAEYSARSNHLEGSLEYLKGELKRLSLQFNKARQGEIDTGMRETFASLMGSSM